MKKNDKIISFLLKKKKSISPLLILTHDFPDPDAIAGAYALKYIVEKKFGIRSKIVYGGVIGRAENKLMVELLRIPVTKLKKSDFKKYLYTAFVDTQPNFNNNPFPENRKATIVIDQHKSYRRPSADLIIVDTSCGAACVVITEALFASGLPITSRIATALVYGIISETQSLYRGTNNEVKRIYLKLLPYCNMTVLAKIQNPPRPKAFFETIAMAILNARVYSSLICANLGKVENPDFVALSADMFIKYDSVNWAFCTGLYKGKMHLSLRSKKSNVNTGEILRKIVFEKSQAGGHGKVAGGSIYIGKNAGSKKCKKLEKLLVNKLLNVVKIQSGISYKFKKGE